MIEKVEIITNMQPQTELEKSILRVFNGVAIKLNEVISAVNKLETMAKNANTVLESLVQENNIHERQIDALQMKLEPEKCETPVDPFAEQRRCICKLCWFWNDNKADKVIGILTGVFDEADRPFERNIDQTLYKHCEPVKPDDDIIYHGE